MTAFYHWLWHLLPANPLLVRIVQNGSRRVRHLWVRMGYLGGMVVLMLMFLLSAGGLESGMSMSALAKAGTQVFAAVAYGQIIFVCLLAPLFMAGAISQEQSGNTFNILATTPLTNLQIVLGSLLGRLFFVLALLLSGLPLFAVLMVFGGVPLASIFVSFAVAGLVALVVGSVAVTLSVWRLGGRKAVFVFVIVVVTYLVGCYAADLLLRQASQLQVQGASLVATPPPPPRTLATDEDFEAQIQAQVQQATGQVIARSSTTWLTPLHPVLVLEASLNSATYQPPAPEDLPGYSGLARFYLSRPLASFTILCLLTSLVLLLASALQVRAIGQGAGVVVAIKQFLRISQAGERRHAPRSVWSNPVAWREASTRGNSAGAIVGRWAFAGLFLLAGFVLLMMYHYDALPLPRDSAGQPVMSSVELFRRTLLTLMLVELAITVLVAIYMSAGCVSREREDGTLDLMLTTPITPRYYIWGKLRGLVSFLSLWIAVPVATAAMVATYTIIGQLNQWPQATPKYLTTSAGQVNAGLMLPEVVILLPMLLVPFVALCVAAGMSRSLKSRGVLGAVVQAMAYLGLFTLVMGFCGFQMVSYVEVLGPVFNAFSPATNLVMLLNPWETVKGFGENSDAGRLALFVAALIAAAVYSVIVYALILMMVRDFDQTMRKLSGTT